MQYDIIKDNLKKLKTEIKKSKKKKKKKKTYKNVTERLTTEMNDKEKRLVDMWIYQLKLEFQTG